MKLATVFMKLAAVFQQDPANEVTTWQSALDELGGLDVDPDVFAALLPEVLAGNAEVLTSLQWMRPSVKRLSVLLELADLHSAQAELEAMLELDETQGRDAALVRTVMRYAQGVGEFSGVPR